MDSYSEPISRCFKSSHLSLLADHRDIKVDDKFVIKLTKRSKNIKREAKESCKVLQFSSEWDFDEALATLVGLDPIEYPKLFIFIIEAKFFGLQKSKQAEKKQRNRKNRKVDKIQKNLLKFGPNRPLILQTLSEDKNIVKFYYKEETATNFVGIDKKRTNFSKMKNFPTFLCSFLDGSFEDFEERIIEMWKVQNSSMILRFTRTLNLSQKFFECLLTKVIKRGTKADFLAMLDASLDENGRTLSVEAQAYLSNLFKETQSANQSTNELSAESEENQLEKESAKSLSGTSIFHTAVENKNADLIDYLITYWTHLIQQLPFEHQVRISTIAYETNQLDVLCDLLEIADFPFPENFKAHDSQIVHDKLHRITAARLKFEAAIGEANIEEIDEFINSNLSLKIVFNTKNKSAMKRAVVLNKYKVYFYLKSLAFKATEFENLEDILSGEELKKANQFKVQQRKKNVDEALPEDQKSINLLCNRSLIHNRRINKEQEKEYRRKIRKWYKDINKIKFGAEFLDVAASCEHLKIIFDFECNSVENVSFQGRNTVGSMYPSSKWIFVGAKLSDKDGNETKKREQKIKGVLAHELCHYVMKLVYENQENPYFKHRKDMKEIFEEIVKSTDKWSTEDSECPDDECNRIISLVFMAYERKDFYAELIVRVVQILTEFDDDEEKQENLQEKYKSLFDFWYDRVVPELRKYLQKNASVVKLNKIVGFLPNISNQTNEFASTKDISSITDHKLTIVTTNIPKLLFINIQKYLQEKCGSLLDSQNFFTEPEKLENQEVWNDFKQVCTDNQELCIFVDCTKGFPDYLGEIFINKDLNFIFVVSNENQHEELTKILNEKNMKDSTKMEINYSWSDLTGETQELLLQNKINFQNNSQFSLMDLLKNENNPEEPSISKIIDDQLLNLLVENSQIIVNVKTESDQSEENFELLFRSRKFNKKHDNFKKGISQEDLLSDVQRTQYVLISDIAGNGKSWTMKNFTKVLREENPTRWVTYVDLKEFIGEFRTKESNLDFSTFIVDKILKPKQKYEAEIFQQLYNNGKVFILFDGFDEIAPNFAEFVSNLAQSFQLNGENQLWIATRDYFEVDLRSKLSFYKTFSLSELTEEEGVNLILESWMLMDMKDKSIKSSNEFIKYVKESPSFENYKKAARQIVKKVAMSERRSIGMPQLFQMVADSFKDNKEAALEFKMSKIYAKFVQTLYKRWSYEKGLIRKDASIESQEYGLKFWDFHQFVAIKGLFAEFVNELFPNYDEDEWTNEEIIACGLMNKMNRNLYFLHETFREFFVADFIAKALKKVKFNKNSCEGIVKDSRDDYLLKIFVNILTIKEFEIVRMFLNDAIEGTSILEKVQPKMQNFSQNFLNMDSFSVFFTKNLENLTDFVINIITELDSQKIMKILDESIEDIAAYTNNSKSFLKFQEFLLSFCKNDDIKKLIIDHEVFQKIIFSQVEIEIFEDFLVKIEARADREFIRDGLKLMRIERWQGNILFYLSRSLGLSSHKFRKTLEIFQKFFTTDEIIDSMEKCNGYGQSILRNSVRGGDKEIFKLLCTEIEIFFVSQNLPHKFKNFIKLNDSKGKNILHWAVKCELADFHEVLWDFLLKLFKNREELFTLVLQKMKFVSNNFIHHLVQNNKNLEILEFTFKILKENFSEVQFQKILKSRGEQGRNLLQSASRGSQTLKCYQFLWKTLRDSCKTKEEFLEIVNEVDENGDDVQKYAIRYSSIKIFNFMLESKFYNKLNTRATH